MWWILLVGLWFFVGAAVGVKWELDYPESTGIQVKHIGWILYCSVAGFFILFVLLEEFFEGNAGEIYIYKKRK